MDEGVTRCQSPKSPPLLPFTQRQRLMDVLVNGKLYIGTVEVGHASFFQTFIFEKRYFGSCIKEFSLFPGNCTVQNRQNLFWDLSVELLYNNNYYYNRK